MEEEIKNGGIIRRKLTYVDRLSTFPDFILTRILSSLPIESAAATSVLSRRWRPLWTGVTRLEIGSDANFPATVDYILRRLTSPKLTAFSVFSQNSLVEKQMAESVFGELCRKNVEEIKVTVVGLLYVPASVLVCQSLVILDLFASELNLELPENGVINLPTLKRLGLSLQSAENYLLETLFRSCPLLEDLHLGFNLMNELFAEIFAPNLKFLYIEMVSTINGKIVIDTPKLEKFTMYDSSSSYFYFVNNPTMLNDAYVDYLDSDESIRGEDYYTQMLKFIEGLSSATSLAFLGFNNIFSYINSIDNVILPIFKNLTRFKTSLGDVGHWKNLLVFLQCFPNLEHLEVSMEDGISVEPVLQLNEWCAPDFVPDCLLIKLQTITISNAQIHKIVSLLEYILHYGNVLEVLCIYSSPTLIYYGHNGVHNLWNEYKFCETLFKLPMSSANCEAVFRGAFINASRSDFKDGLLICQIQYFE